MVSIIVPVYKTETLLPRCIDSIIHQTYQDWELVLVDDGSPDNCPKICDDFAKRNTRIKVIHQTNAGNNSARMQGLRHATGDYVMFVDSDDTLVKNALEVLWGHMNFGYDMVRGQNVRFIEGAEFKEIENRKINDGIICGSDQYIKAVLKGDLAPYLWGAMYKKNLFDEVMFSKTVSFPRSEDWMIHIMIGKKIRKALCIKDVVYNYLINSNSIMQTRIFSYAYVKRMEDALAIELSELSNEIKNIFVADRVCENIKCLFLPELPFSVSAYDEILQRLSDKRIDDIVKTMIDKKFLLFINCLPMFYLYSRIYSFLFLKIKLRNRRRNVLY